MARKQATLDKKRLAYIEGLKLGRGSHEPPSNGLVAACVMEAVSYVAGEPFSDHPQCARSALLLLDRMIEVGRV